MYCSHWLLLLSLLPPSSTEARHCLAKCPLQLQLAQVLFRAMQCASLAAWYVPVHALGALLDAALVQTVRLTLVRHHHLLLLVLTLILAHLRGLFLGPFFIGHRPMLVHHQLRVGPTIRVHQY